MKRAGFAICAAILALLVSGQVKAESFNTPAKQAYMIDLSTGTVLLDKNGDTPMPPASMSKLMTVYMAFERLAENRLSLKDTFLISEKAWRKGGSKMFVKVGEHVSVADLLRGIIVQSGNDACIVLAEGLEGSEEEFAQAMNRRAAEIGLTGSHFTNATGWPDPEHYMSPHDIAHLSRLLIEKFPEYYKYFGEVDFTYNGIRQGNRNPLLYRDIGVDGLKTGHTEASGYGLAASAERDGRRLVLVVNGLDSMKARAAESLRLMEWGFRNFNTYALLKAGEAVGEAAVWLGEEKRVRLVVGESALLTMSRRARRDLKVKLIYDGPVAAPIVKGKQIGTLAITAPGLTPRQVPVLAGQDVPRLGLFGRLGVALGHVLWGEAK